MKKRLMTFLACLFLSIGLAMAQTRVTGTVTSSEDGEPIMGATVKVVGNNAVGTITDIDGNFSLELKNANAELEFSYIGMTTKKVKASAKMTVILDADSHMLENVIITGYGSAKKLGSVVGAVSTVSGEKMKTVATPNFTDALAGQVSGLSVLTSSGDPSAAASIRLRGVNSMSSSNEPLFILDGAPISSSFFQTLNPSDIANITVLKDAASTAIYGSRAANGVIVITSRNGKYNESAQVVVKAQYGISTPTSDGVTMMNSQQYVKFRDIIGQPVSDAIRKAAQHINTNWRDEMLSSSAPTSDINATMQGGGNSVNYYLSFNHHEQEGLIQSSGMQRNTLAARINARLNRFFKVGFNSNFGDQRYVVNREQNGSGVYSTDPLVFARQAMPFDAPYYYHFDENGNIVKDGKAYGLLYTDMPTPEFLDNYRKQDGEQVTLNIGINETFTPMEGLTFTAQQSLYGYDSTQEVGNIPHEEIVTPMGQIIDPQDGSLADGFSRYYAYTLTHTGEWKKNFGDHYVNLLVGEETRIQRSRSFSAYTTGQTDDRLMLLSSGTKANPGDMGDSRSEAVANSIFGNVEYNFKEKYYVYGSLRRDGSSKFAPDHRWGTFWSAGAKWNAKKESFLAPVKWLDNLTLSVNYGTTGNDAGASTYGYFGLFGEGGMYNGVKSIGIAQASNAKLTWETVSKFNVGLNMSLFRRLDLDFNFYRNKTSDMLMPIPYSYTTGLSSGAGNIGGMTNTGFEVSANVQLIATKDINWTFTANVGYNKNRITELFQGRDEYLLANSGLNLKIGHAYGEFYSVRNAGVDPRTGEPQWLDKDGNITKVFNEERDAVFTGKNRYAPWIGGFGTNFTWKGLSVIADFAWAADKWMMQNDDYFIKNATFATSWNQRVEMLNIWTTPGQVTDIPAYGYEIQFDDKMIQDASFLRMKTLTVQYDLPKKWLAPTRYIKGVKVFGIARNLFTITSFEGYDPEPDINLVQFNYPNTRQFMFGAELTF
mgnify:FL=1